MQVRIDMKIDDRILINNGLPKVNGVQGGTQSAHKLSVNQTGNFKELLGQRISEDNSVKFSKHAEQRMELRHIKITGEGRKKLGAAVERAAGKGVKDSLVVMDDMAFLINIKSKTVVTVMSNSELKDNIFTNIDGAVFA